MSRLCLRPLVNPATMPDIRLSSGESKTVGRAVNADIVIDEPSLSRLHARLTVDEDGQLSVEDLGSTNGVFINGEAHPSGRLAAGDHVRFGFLEYLVDAERATQAVRADHTILRMAVPEHAPNAVDRVALEALLATSRELMAFGDLPGLLERVLDRLHAIVKSDRSAILLVDPATGELKPRAVRPAGAYTSVSEFASATAVREALAAREAIVVYDTRLDARLQAAESVALAGVRSVICVPLFGRTGAIGALYADQLGIATFTPELVQYAGAFGAHVAAALETAQLYEDRERYFRATLEAFAKAIDARDHYTAGHSERVTAYTLVLARHVGFAPDQLELVRQAGMLHDIGKVGVPDAVLLKKGPLERDERAVMESHVLIGYSMLEPLPFIHGSLAAIRGHHERWDGRGYPDRLAGTGIHHHARLMGVADSFDAMTSARPYRAALPIDEAVRRLRKDRGKQFDPAAIDAFDATEAEFRAICESARSTKVASR